MGNNNTAPTEEIAEVQLQTELPKVQSELLNPLLTESDWPKNQYGYYITGVQKFDDIFEKAGEIFEEFESFRIQIKLKLERVHELAGTTKGANPNILDAIKVLLWSFSATAGGHIDNVLRLEGDSHLKLEVNKMEAVKQETWELYEALNDLLKSFIEESNAAADLTNKISNLITDLGTLTKEDYYIKAAQALQMDPEKLQSIIEKNEQMFFGVHRMMHALSENSLKIGNEYMKFLSNLHLYLKEADIGGSKAAEMQMFEPKKIAELHREGKI
jgi:hypothetical protein